jgi:hypothetical protein
MRQGESSACAAMHASKQALAMKVFMVFPLVQIKIIVT